MLSKKQTVLVIEDDPGLLYSITEALEMEGFEVVSSTNSSPLHSLDIINPDLIILDHFLGNSLGQTICKELKEDFEASHIPVILISGTSNLEEIAFACKADAYLKKPFSGKLLVAEVKKLYAQLIKIQVTPIL